MTFRSHSIYSRMKLLIDSQQDEEIERQNDVKISRYELDEWEIELRKA